MPSRWVFAIHKLNDLLSHDIIYSQSDMPFALKRKFDQCRGIERIGVILIQCIICGKRLAVIYPSAPCEIGIKPRHELIVPKKRIVSVVLPYHANYVRLGLLLSLSIDVGGPVYTPTSW
jgi:hypothetical protein